MFLGRFLFCFAFALHSTVDLVPLGTDFGGVDRWLGGGP